MIIALQKLSYEQLAEQLSQSLAEQKIIAEELLQFKKKHQDLEGKYFAQQHELAQLRRMIFGSKSERFEPVINPSQIALDLNIEPVAAIEISEKEITYTRKDTTVKSNHKGRLPLPADLPRNEIILEPDENTEGCKQIGEEITEELDYTPGKLFVNKYIRKKYAMPGGEGIVLSGIKKRRRYEHVVVNKT